MYYELVATPYRWLRTSSRTDGGVFVDIYTRTDPSRKPDWKGWEVIMTLTKLGDFDIDLLRLRTPFTSVVRFCSAVGYAHKYLVARCFPFLKISLPEV